ncbi:hypothetical protein VI34_03655 [Methylophilales bacterium MBRSG12]|nr:hypothetical protein UZ34_06670 [Methylophilales bacterium MBRSF5]AKO67146.1 hypothetical protein VI34_03655 [Methylophilales bacterium MBRSG12]
MKKLFLILILFVSALVFAETEEELFEQVFDNPQSLELNFKLARIQLKNGNLKGAAASLERILVRFENESTAQLLLARINRQLKNFTEADRLYNQIISNPNAPQENIALARQELGLAEDAKGEQSLWAFNGFYSVGWGKRNNARAASINNEVFYSGTIYTSAVSDEAEYFRQGILGLNLSRGFESSNDRLISSVSLNDRSYDSSYKDGRNQSYNFTLGYDKEMFNGYTRFSVNGGEMHLAKQNFLGFTGIRIDHRRVLMPNLLLNFGVGGTKLDFRYYDGIPDNNLKSGWNHTANIGLTKTWKRFRGNINYTAGRMSAKEDYYSYKSDRVDMSLTTDYGIGSTTIFKSFTKNNYEDVNTGISPNIERRDVINNYGVSWSIGLKNYDIPSATEPTLTIFYSQGSNLSNLVNYKRDDNREWMLSISQNF